MKELVITNYKNSVISAVYEDKQMVQVTASRKKPVSLGNIYVGRVDNIIKNINAAFVNISEQMTCYLDLSVAEGALFVKKQSEKKISIGDELIVQITKEDVKTKAPVVTTNISITGKYAVIVHQGSGIQISKKIKQKAMRNEIREKLECLCKDTCGVVVRTNAQYASMEEILAEGNALLAEYQRICKEGIHQAKYSVLYQELSPYLVQMRDFRQYTLDKVVTNLSHVKKEIEVYLSVNPTYTAEKAPVQTEFIEEANDLAIRYKINHFMDLAQHKTVFLNSGATIVIEPTEALTVIDVNTGKAISGKKTTEDTFFKINMEAAKEIAAQIRLRNLSGIIIVDFINMQSKEQQDALMNQLREWIKMDAIQTELVDITSLGLVELTRKKVCKTLAEQLADSQ